MAHRRCWVDWRTWLSGVACVLLPCAIVPAQEPIAKPPLVSTRNAPLPKGIALADISPHYRERVRLLVEHSTLRASGPLEVFHGRLELYQWLLDHPDRGVAAWRRLGAKCGDITARGNGRFGWSDGQGSDIHWDTVLSTPQIRVWLADGTVKPGPFFPAVPVQAVAVIRFSEGRDASGRPIIRHQGELYFYSDSKAVALATELLGQSAQNLAAQAVGQMELFFSAIVWYLDHHPERAQSLLAALKNDKCRILPGERVTKDD